MLVINAMDDTNFPESLFCSNNFATAVKEKKGHDCKDLQSCSRNWFREKMHTDRSMTQE